MSTYASLCYTIEGNKLFYTQAQTKTLANAAIAKPFLINIYTFVNIECRVDRDQYKAALHRIVLQLQLSRVLNDHIEPDCQGGLLSGRVWIPRSRIELSARPRVNEVFG